MRFKIEWFSWGEFVFVYGKEHAPVSIKRRYLENKAARSERAQGVDDRWTWSLCVAGVWVCPPPRADAHRRVARACGLLDHVINEQKTN